MAYMIHFDDHLDSADQRKVHRPAHVAHLKKYLAKIVSGGPLFNDAGVPCGGVVLLDVDDKAEAELFAKDDPYTTAGVHRSVTVTRYNPSFFDGKFLG